MLVESFRAFNGGKRNGAVRGCRQTALPIAFAVALLWGVSCRDSSAPVVQPVWTPAPTPRPAAVSPPTAATVEQTFDVSKPPNGMPQRMLGRPAPEFVKVKGWADGTSTTLAALRGQVVVLDFFFNACGACQADMPKVIALDRRYAQDGLVVIGVHADLERDVAQMKARMNRSIQHPVVLDGGGAVTISGTAMTTPGETCAAYGVYVFPTKVLIDRQGIVRAVIQHSETGYEKQIEILLQEPAPAQ